MFMFALGSENRKKIVITLFRYPRRQWSCSGVEEITKIPHATVFRTMQGLEKYGLLKSTRINKKDILYELTESPLGKELVRLARIEEIIARNMAKEFVRKVKSKQIVSIILYGSTVKGAVKPESDIDILVVIDKHSEIQERKINDIAAELSSKYNKTIAPTIMTLEEVKNEKEGQFIKSVKEMSEILYGKESF